MTNRSGSVWVCSANDAACCEVPVARRCQNCPEYTRLPDPEDKFREAIRAAATRAGLLHSDAPLTDDQLLLLLQNVADAAYYARVCHS